MLARLRHNAETHRLGRERWRSKGSDPYFLLQRAPGGPRFAVIELAGENAPLSVSIYLRGEDGFSETRRIELPENRRALLVVNLSGPAARGVRIDPTEEPDVEFRARWWTRRRLSALRRLVSRRIAEYPGLAPTLIGPDPGLAGFFALRTPRIGRPSVAEQLVAVWESAALAAAEAPPPEGPSISFLVPVYDADPTHLDALAASAAGQGPHVQLVLSDDGSRRAETRAWLDAAEGRPGVTVLRAARNGGIAAATNAALAAATGEWVGLVDHDDLLSPYAVDRIRRALAAGPQARFLYTDEAIVDAAGRPVSVYCKPAFDPVLLSGVNYVNHLSLYRRDRLAALGGLRDGFQGSQDYELVLRYCAGLEAGEILHLPYPAYKWRQLESSLSHARLDDALAAARRALETHYGAALGPVAAEPSHLLPQLHRLRFATPPTPRVSVVIPNRDSFELIDRLLQGLFEGTACAPFETIVVDNGSADPRVLALYEREAARRPFRALIREEPFNFSRMVNRGAAAAEGEALLLLNNDIAVTEPGWLDEMIACLAYPGVGIVGAKLLYPNRTIQHAGVILGLGGLAGHWFYKADRNAPGPMGRLAVRNSMTVVTAACMLVTRACWEDVGGFDEEAFAVAYNDVDFCARARARDHGVVWTPFAELIHDESVSRGSDRFGERARRFRREKELLAARHGTAAFHDPCYNPALHRYSSRAAFRPSAQPPEARSFHGLFAGALAPPEQNGRTPPEKQAAAQPRT